MTDELQAGEPQSREDHFALDPASIVPFEFDTEVAGQFTLAEAIESGLIGYWTGTQWLTIR